MLAKDPVAGQVKTRLCPPCTPEEAAAFATAFLRDTSAMLMTRRIADRADVWCSHTGTSALLQDLFGDRMLQQRGADLSERITNLTQDLFAKGYEHVVVMCADCPTVTPEYLENAMDMLTDSDIVFGPARDGGCVLVGVTRPETSVFSGVVMSTDHVLDDMVRVAESRSLTFHVLSPRFDIDTVVDLTAAQNSGELEGARHTQAALADSPLVKSTGVGSSGQ